MSGVEGKEMSVSSRAITVFVLNVSFFFVDGVFVFFDVDVVFVFYAGVFSCWSRVFFGASGVIHGQHDDAFFVFLHAFVAISCFVR